MKYRCTYPGCATFTSRGRCSRHRGKPDPEKPPTVQEQVSKIVTKDDRWRTISDLMTVTGATLHEVKAALASIPDNELERNYDRCGFLSFRSRHGKLQNRG